MSEDEPKNKFDAVGDETHADPKDDKKDISEFDKLKASNDEFEKELIRGRQLKAESQKLEAERMIAPTAGGHIEAEKLSKEEMESNARVQRIGEAAGAEWAKKKE